VNEARIRPARPADGESVAAMCARLAADDGESGSQFTAARFRADGFGPRREFDCLIADLDGAAAGYALFYPEYNTDVMQRSAYLVDLYIEPAARRRGLGRRLVAATARAAAERGATTLAWGVKRANAGARAFYRGFAREQPELFYGVAAGDRLERLAAVGPPAGLTLRVAERRDVPILARFIAELLLATEGEPPADIEGPLARDGFGSEPAFAAILAEDRDGPLGHALFWRAYDTVYAARGAFLSDLYVGPAARRRGVGLALLGGFARWTRALGGSYGFWQILASNAPAIAFYRPIAEEDRSAIPCTLEGERFRALAAAAPASAIDG
jgi:GNAT superfamily N-acetyltransferase